MNSRFATIITIIFAFAVSGCPQETEWTAEQKDVHDAMLAWSKAVSAQDGEAMWEMLSPDAQELYERELKGEGGVRQTVKLNQAAIRPDARTPEDERERIKKMLKTLPEDPDAMSVKEYYVWRLTPDLTQEGADRTARLFDKTNISLISIEGENATVVLKKGDPDRYSWVRHDGVWKFDLPPSILRALEDTRKREKQTE